MVLSVQKSLVAVGLLKSVVTSLHQFAFAAKVEASATAHNPFPAPAVPVVSASFALFVTFVQTPEPPAAGVVA